MVDRPVDLIAAVGQRLSGTVSAKKQKAPKPSKDDKAPAQPAQNSAGGNRVVEGEMLAANGQNSEGEQKPRRANGFPNLIPFQPGRSGNPKGRPKLAQEVREMAQNASPAIMQRLIDTALDPDTDDRVATVTGLAVLERAWGKPKEMADIGEKRRIDFSKYTPTQIAQLRKLIEKGMEGGESGEG